MEKFNNYILLISLTILFIFAGGFLGDKIGMILAILISSTVYTFIYYFAKEQRDSAKEKQISNKNTNNNDAEIYAMVERLVKRTDILYLYQKGKKTFKGVEYGTI